MTIERRPPGTGRGRRLVLMACVNEREGDLAACCARRGGREIAAALTDGMAERGLKVPVRPIECLSHCEQGPSLRLLPSGTRFQYVSLADVPQVLDVVAEYAAAWRR